MATSPDTTAPDTIVLIHGLWMTPRSWEHWVPYYEDKGYRVLTPTYPGLEVEVEALNANPDVIASLTVPETVAHLASVVTELDKPPIIMVTPSGGLSRSSCSTTAAARSASPSTRRPPRGCAFPHRRRSRRCSRSPSTRPTGIRRPASRLRSSTPPSPTRSAKRKSRKAYERYHIPAPGNWIWAYGLIANIKPGHQETWVNYRNDARAPLLFISGGEDKLMPPSVNKSNAKHYKSNTVTEVPRVPRPLALHLRRARLGGGRRLRPRLGGRARGHSHRGGNQPNVTGSRRTVASAPVVSLRPITEANRTTAEALRVSPAQEQFVSSVAESLLEAADEPNGRAIYWAVYSDETPVGFVMISDEVGSPDYIPHYLWKLLIDEQYQGQGLGTATLDLIVEYFRGRPGVDVLWTSAGQGDGSPIAFYERYGFERTGEVVFDDEVLLRLELR